MRVRDWTTDAILPEPFLSDAGDDLKALFLTTGTPDTEKLVRSFTSHYPETKVVQYDLEGVELVKIAEETRPDVTIYIGAIGAFHNGCSVPTTEVLCRINKIAPMIHICSDAADYPWWPLLEEYHAAGAFRLQVTIDGSYDNPIARFGRVALTPVDPILFINRPWAERNHKCGFAGGGGARCDWILPLKNKGILTWFNESGYVSYDQFCTYYSQCQLVVNDSRTGTGTKRHMKGRFVEASLAGAVLVESRDSPARQWFEPGVDFLEWESTGEIENHIVAADARRGENEGMSQRLRNKIVERHSAGPFWRETLGSIGL